MTAGSGEVVVWNRCATCDAIAAHNDQLRALVAELLEHIASGDDYADPAKMAAWQERAGLGPHP